MIHFTRPYLRHFWEKIFFPLGDPKHLKIGIRLYKASGIKGDRIREDGLKNGRLKTEIMKITRQKIVRLPLYIFQMSKAHGIFSLKNYS